MRTKPCRCGECRYPVRSVGAFGYVRWLPRLGRCPAIPAGVKDEDLRPTDWLHTTARAEPQ